VLTGLYVGYVLLVSLIKPLGTRPAGRSPHHPRGRRQAPACVAGILTIISVIAAVAFAKNYAPRREEHPAGRPKTIVVSMCVGVGVAFFAAVINKAPSSACCRAWPSA
jgi:hypothetical protein